MPRRFPLSSLEATLSFPGLGVEPDVATWGHMLNGGRLYLSTAWWITAVPRLAIFLIVVAVNLLGDQLRDRSTRGYATRCGAIGSEATMTRLTTILRIAAFVAVLSAAGVYLSDYVWIEYRLSHAAGPDALGTVTFYYATPLKNGRLDIFYNQPQTEVCVYALFPHGGYRPCWYAMRDRVRTI